jgi:diguanylate cyclase (GGDEF)-like protein/PAS domain S-box-containing protein
VTMESQRITTDFYLLDLLPLGALVTDNRLRLMHINRWLRERLSLDPAAWRGQPLAAIFPEIQERGLLTAYETVLNGLPQLTISSRLHRYFLKLPADKRLAAEFMPQTASIHAIQQNGNVDGILTIIQDVTDRVLSEQEFLAEITKLNTLQKLDEAFATYDMQQRYEIIVKSARLFFSSELVTLLIQNGDILYLAAKSGPNEAAAQSTIHAAALPATLPDHPKIWKNGEPHLVSFPGARAEMVAPIRLRGSVVCWLDVTSTKKSAFTEDEISMLETLALRAGLAIQMGQLYQEIEEGRAFYQSILNHSSDIIYVVDRQLRLTAVNVAWDEFARQHGGDGWLSTRAMGRNLLDGFSGEKRQEWEKICADILNGKRTAYEEEILCHSPEQQRWFILRARPLFGAIRSQVEGIVFSAQDITAHKIALHQAEAANQQLETLVLTGQVLSAQLEINSLLEEALRLIASIFQAQCVTLFDAQSNRLLKAHNISEFHKAQLEQVPLNITQTFAQKGNSGILPNLLEVNDSLSFLKPIAEHDQLRQMMYVVFTGKRRFSGLLSVFSNGKEQSFSTHDLTLLRSIAGQLSLALDNAALYEEQQRLAVTDSLTGLANRRRFDQELEREFHRTRRTNWSLTLVMFDLDNFKYYNDTYGHPLGDKILCEVARILQTNLRNMDLAARFGGDEFAIIMPETSIEQAFPPLMRLQKKAAAIGAVLGLPESSPPITLSIGVADAPLHAKDKTALVRAADIALYQAKRGGKNKIIVYSK